MTTLFDELLKEACTITEGHLSLVDAGFEAIFELIGLLNDTLATTTTAIGSLDEDGEGDLVLRYSLFGFLYVLMDVRE